MQSVAELSEGQLIEIDVKRLCNCYNREDRQSAIHILNAFASKNNVVLGRIKNQSKSNEITAIPASLTEPAGYHRFLDINRCQTNIAEKIVESGGDYLQALKGNQMERHDAVRDELAGAMNQEVICLEKNHGRGIVSEWVPRMERAENDRDYIKLSAAKKR